MQLLSSIQQTPIPQPQSENNAPQMENLEELFVNDVTFSETEYEQFLEQKSKLSFVIAQMKVEFLKFQTFHEEDETKELTFAPTLQNHFVGLEETLDIDPVQPARTHHQYRKCGPKKVKHARVQAKLTRKDLDRIRSLKPATPIRHTNKPPAELRRLMAARLADKRETLARQQQRQRKFDAHVQFAASNDKVGTLSQTLDSLIMRTDIQKLRSYIQQRLEQDYQSLGLARFIFENDIDSDMEETHAFFLNEVANCQFDLNGLAAVANGFMDYGGSALSFVASIAAKIWSVFGKISAYIMKTLFTTTVKLAMKIPYMSEICLFLGCAVIYFIFKEVGMTSLGLAIVSMIVSVNTEGIISELASLFTALITGWNICNLTQPWQNKYSLNLNLNDARVQFDLEDANMKPFVFLIFGALVLLTGNVVPSMVDYTAFVKKIDMHAKLIKGSTVIFDSLEASMNSICEHFGTTFCGFGKNAALPDEVHDLLKEIKRFDIKRRNEMTSNMRLCEEVQRMFDTYNDFRLKYRSNRSIVTLLDKVQGTITNLYNKAVSFFPVKGTNRIEPVTMMLTGASGVGKSSILYHVGTAVLYELGMITDTMPDEEIHKLVSECTYARMVEQEFWDGYANQPCTLIDDFGQMKDSTSNPNLEFMELIRMSNSFPYPLHMASVEQKSNTTFKSRVVVATTNLTTINPASISCAEAVIRRVDMPFSVSLKPEYADSNGRLKDQFKTGSINTDIYEFRHWDMNSGNINDVAITFDELIATLRHRMQLKEKKFVGGKKDVKAYLRKLKEIDHPELRTQRLEAEQNARNKRAADMQAQEMRARAQMAREEAQRQFRQQPIADQMRQVFVGMGGTTVRPYVEDAEPQGFLSDISESIAIAKETVFGRAKQYWPKKKITIVRWPTGTPMTFEETLDFLTTRIYLREKGEIVPDPTDADDLAWVIYRRFVEQEEAREEYILKHMHSGYAWPTVKPLRTQLIEAFDKKLDLFEEVEVGQTVSDIFDGIAVQFQRWRVFDWFVGALATLFAGLTVYQVFNQIRGVKEDHDQETQLESSKGRVNLRRTRLESGKTKHLLAKAKLESGKGKQPQAKPKLETEEVNMQQVVSKAIAQAQRDPLAQSIMDAEMQAWKSENAADLAIQIRRNQLLLTFEVKEGNTPIDLPPIKVLFIKGRDMLINKHYTVLFDEHVHGLNLVLQKHGSDIVSRFDAATVFATQRVYKRSGVDTDLVVLTLPKTCPQFKDLTHHVMQKAYLSNLQGNRVVMTLPGEPWIQKFGEVTKVAAQTYRDFKQERHVAETIMSSIGSVDGDCGATYIVDEPTVTRRIVGFHFAGLKGGACAVPLVYEDLMEVLTPGENLEPDTISYQAPPVFANSTAQYLGKVHPAPATPSKSKLQQTQLFNQVFPTKVKPAHLFASLSDDRSPMYKGIQKQFTQQAMLDPEILEKAVLSYCSMLSTLKCDISKMIVLDINTAIAGNETDEFICGINRSRSAGFPYCMTTKKGKTEWFGSDDWTLDSEKALEFKQDCAYKTELMRQGTNVPFIFVDTLKDETRPIEKVDAGKTRVFAAAPMDFIVIFRQYFLSFIAHMMVNRIDSESAVGIRAQSTEWHELAKHLLSKGNNMIAGDFSNFDGTLNKEILDAVLQVVEVFYSANPDYDSTDAIIREKLWESITNSLHLCCGHLYKLDHSQPSGNPMTAILNSMYNSIAVRYVWYINHEQEFNDYVTMIAYGDDNIISVGGMDDFNQVSISEGFAKIGMIYTMETKDAATGRFRPLTEVSFLKRGFRFEPTINMYVGPLEMDSILECFNWIHQTTDEKGVITQNFDMANAELALHDDETFKETIAKLQRAIALVYGIVLPVQPLRKLRVQIRDGSLIRNFPNLQWA